MGRPWAFDLEVDVCGRGAGLDLLLNGATSSRCPPVDGDP